MEEMYVNVYQLTPELKAELDARSELELVVILDDEELQELNFQDELDDEDI